MSNWKEEFKKAIVDTLVKLGAPVADQPSFYGWLNHDWQTLCAIVDAVGIDYGATTWTSSSWEEFQGTFHEGDTRVYGVDMDLVLVDGRRLRWRYRGTAGELIMEISH